MTDQIATDQMAKTGQTQTLIDPTTTDPTRPPIVNQPVRGGKIARLKRAWNTTDDDFELDFPCDRDVREPHGIMYRAVDVDAPRSVLWRWLCQLRVAPYSYDWIDNWGRQSPRELTPGVEDLELGQRMVTIMQIVELVPDEHLTLRITRWNWLWGEASATYRLVPRGDDRCRLVFKCTAHDARGPVGWVRRAIFPWGELFMTRKQLLNLKKLAEKSASGSG